MFRARNVKGVVHGAWPGFCRSTPPLPQPPRSCPPRPLSPRRRPRRRPARRSHGRRPSRPRRRRARLTVEGGVERAPCALDRPEYQNIRFTLRDVVFDHLRGLTADQLRAAFAPYLGQENNVAVVCEIRDRAATILREAGYIAAVEVPEQRIADGVVHFEVLMARLVGLAGARQCRPRRADHRRLPEQADRAGGVQPLRRRALSAARRRSAGLPCPARLALGRGGARRGDRRGHGRAPAGAGRRHRPESRLARARPLGRAGAGAALRPDRARRPHHPGRVQHRRHATSSRRSRSPTISGSAARASRSAASSPTPGRVPTSASPGSTSNRAPSSPPLEASYPFIRRQLRTLRGAIGFDLIDQEIDFNTLPLNEDRLRVAFARLNYDSLGLVAGNPRYTIAEPRWRFGASVELRRGLDIFERERALRPRLRQLPLAERGAADPARGRPDGDRAARRRLWRVPADAAGHDRARPARPVEQRPAAELRGILGRQLHRRPRLRSRHPARRQRRRPPGRAALRQRDPDRARRVPHRALRLLRPGLGVERGPGVRAAAARN